MTKSHCLLSKTLFQFSLVLSSVLVSPCLGVDWEELHEELANENIKLDSLKIFFKIGKILTSDSFKIPSDSRQFDAFHEVLEEMNFRLKVSKLHLKNERIYIGKKRLGFSVSKLSKVLLKMNSKPSKKLHLSVLALQAVRDPLLALKYLDRGIRQIQMGHQNDDYLMSKALLLKSVIIIEVDNRSATGGDLLDENVILQSEKLLLKSLKLAESAFNPMRNEVKEFNADFLHSELLPHLMNVLLSLEALYGREASQRFIKKHKLKLIGEYKDRLSRAMLKHANASPIIYLADHIKSQKGMRSSTAKSQLVLYLYGQAFSSYWMDEYNLPLLDALAEFHEERGDYAQASEVYDEAVLRDDNKRNFTLRSKRARYHMRMAAKYPANSDERMRALQEARDGLEEAIAEYLPHPSKYKNSEKRALYVDLFAAYRDLAYVYYKLGQMKEAVAYYDAADYLGRKYDVRSLEHRFWEDASWKAAWKTLTAAEKCGRFLRRLNPFYRRRLPVPVLDD